MGTRWAPLQVCRRDEKSSTETPELYDCDGPEEKVNWRIGARPAAMLEAGGGFSAGPRREVHELRGRATVQSLGYTSATRAQGRYTKRTTEDQMELEYTWMQQGIEDGKHGHGRNALRSTNESSHASTGSLSQLRAAGRGRADAAIRTSSALNADAIERHATQRVVLAEGGRPAQEMPSERSQR